MMNAADKSKPSQRSVSGRLGFKLVGVAVGLTLSMLLVEALFRVVEYRENSKNFYEGQGGIWFSDKHWGWKPTPGPFHIGTSEFDVNGSVNALYMNDAEVDLAADETRTRILALGDSHTFAAGVSSDQTWPKLLEQKLNLSAGNDVFKIYNGGVTGFNLHQYLLRYLDQGPLLQPHFVIVGLSYATDLYDLLPPDHGGWIYGNSSWPRDYFDFAETGQLVQRRWEGGVTAAQESQVDTVNRAAQIRRVLDNSAVFRYLRRSNLALMIGSKVKVKGQSLWPNMEVVLEKNVSDRHQYQWRLFEALLLRLDQETRKQSAKLVVVGIPYLPQIYDELWESTFGANQNYNRRAANDRVAAFCASNSIKYIETLDTFIERSKQLKRWLHHRKDAHPTQEGQIVIADTVFNSKAIVQKK